MQKSKQSTINLEFTGYLNQTLRDTMENWQSEFLQLMWQVGGLSFLPYVGSPQSKESERRLEKKLDAILQKVEPERAQEIIKQLQKRISGEIEERRALVTIRKDVKLFREM